MNYFSIKFSEVLLFQWNEIVCSYRPWTWSSSSSKWRRLVTEVSQNERHHEPTMTLFLLSRSSTRSVARSSRSLGCFGRFAHHSVVHSASISRLFRNIRSTDRTSGLHLFRCSCTTHLPHYHSGGLDRLVDVHRFVFCGRKAGPWRVSRVNLLRCHFKKMSYILYEIISGLLNKCDFPFDHGLSQMLTRATSNPPILLPSHDSIYWIHGQ